MMWPSRGSFTTAVPCSGSVRTRSLAGSGLVSFSVTRIGTCLPCPVPAWSAFGTGPSLVMTTVAWPQSVFPAVSTTSQFR